MSEAPRVEINHTVFPDLDPSAPSNRASKDSSALPQTNGNANGSLAQSAQRTGNSILESRVRGTNAPEVAEPQLTPYMTVLSAPRTPPKFPSNHPPAAQNAMSSAANHPSVQSAKDTVVNGEVSATKAYLGLWTALTVSLQFTHPHQTLNEKLNYAGPVGQNVQAEATKTRNEFADLANSRQTPEHKAATGQNLTRRQPLQNRREPS